VPHSINRIISLLILVASLFCFSGVSRACLLLADPAAAADNCCPADHQQSDDSRDDSRDTGSSLECPCCAACSGVIIVTTVTVPCLVVTDAAHPLYRTQIPPTGYLSAIDRPPEAA